jgi:hypothetical protein
MALVGSEREWHLIRKPKAPFVCDECGKQIPLEQADSFTTLEKMFFETPPAGYTPCNASFDPLRAGYGDVKH